MQKRRVGVTARSRQTVGNRETGCLQVATEIAAPLEFENTNGHRGERRNQSADGSMATRARETVGRIESSGGSMGLRDPETARYARMRRCLKLLQGASP